MKIGGVDFEPPVMNAACSIAKSTDDVKAWAGTKAGVILVGSITLEAREGNAEPRWFTEEHFALNSFGMPNGGADYYRKHLPEMVELAHDAGKKFALSIAGFRREEYAELAKLADDAKVDLLELNVGCPNVSVDGAQKPIVSFDTAAMSEIIATVSSITNIPLMLKLSPYSNPAQLADVAKRIADSGNISAVVTSNTFPNGLMLENGEPLLASEFGGVSGRAMLPIVLGQVRQFRKLLPEHIAVIGVGGIETKADVELYKQAGADAVQVATLAVKNGHSAIDKVIV